VKCNFKSNYFQTVFEIIINDHTRSRHRPSELDVVAPGLLPQGGLHNNRTDEICFSRRCYKNVKRKDQKIEQFPGAFLRSFFCLRFEKRFEFHVEMCHQLGKSDPLALCGNVVLVFMKNLFFCLFLKVSCYVSVCGILSTDAVVELMGGFLPRIATSRSSLQGGR
jgi:hypothetical protein